MSAPTRISRRAFVRVSTASGAGLALAFYLPGIAEAAVQDPNAGQNDAFVPNAWIRIGADGTTTILSGQSEMGQGVHTALAMILAEELDADWTRIRVEQAPTAEAYGNPTFGGTQVTVASASVRGFWMPLRKAGAAARAMLVSAAAAEWSAAPESLRTESGTVIHPDGRRLPYHALAARAATVPVPTDVVLKDSSDFRLVGRSLPRVDIPAKVNGRAVFGLDVRVPGMLTAVVARSPVFGGRLRRYDATEALRVRGVRHVIPVSAGVAVVADGYWSAKRGRDVLMLEWEEGALANLDSAELRRNFASRAEEPGLVARTDGDAAAALPGASKLVEAVYEVPFVSHSPMEPLNATAHVTADRCVVWAPTQGQTNTRANAARLTGLPAEAVEVHTTMLGGAFGRGTAQDAITDAIELSKAVDAPVQVIWSREDDTQHGYYRPASHHRLSAGLEASGRPVAWMQTIVTPSVFGRFRPIDVVDSGAVEGAADRPYAIPNVLVTWVREEPGVPLGTWRSVGHSGNTFVTESFIDELAATAGQDPYEYRRALLAGNPRLRAVLDLAAEKAGWGSPLAPERGRGIAVVEKNDSYCAQVAEVSVDARGAVRVHRVVCAVDCGTVINPDGLRAQMEGGILFGLSAALGEAITLRRGRVKQSNFHDYRLLRMEDAPAIEVHILSSRESPGGAGEPGVPPIAPAVANAVFAASGKRIRSLPIHGT